MHGEAKYLIRFLGGAEKHFVIPVYQRNYAWKIPQCQRLYDDLVKVIRMNRENHFLGSIVSFYNPDSASQEYLIIDGQQRLTTISLLLLALYHLLRSGTISSKDIQLTKKIYEEYLVDKYQPDNTKIKLKHVQGDRQAFQALFDEKNIENIENCDIKTNYKFFRDKIKWGELSADELFESIRRLMIIDITLNHKDNPQLIFESLNSTGLELEEGDKIRNYIFMGIPPKKQVSFYNKYWCNIEAHVKNHLSDFLRHYLSIKQQKIPTIKKVYVSFKEYVEQKTDGDIEKILQDMGEYAHCYERLMKTNTIFKDVNTVLKRWKKLDFSVTIPFLLEVFYIWREKVLAEPEVVELLQYIENYLFRRMICDFPTNTLNKVFVILDKEITALDGTKEQYVEKLKYILENKKEKTQFPPDEMFLECLTNRNIYTMSSKIKQYTLERLENGNSLESKNIYEMLERGTCSIEHIMPQQLTPAWKTALGEDWETIHEIWLHRLANLTLTAYNSSYSNKTFEQKRDMEEIGLKESGFRINQLIAQKQKWTLEELLERNEDLKKIALRLWSFSKSHYNPIQDAPTAYTLEDDLSFSDKVILKFQFQGVEQVVKNWTDFFEKALMMLHETDKTVLNQLAEGDKKRDLSIYVCRSQANLQKQGYRAISKNIQVFVNVSTQHKITILKRLFELYHIETTELILYVKNKSKQLQ